MVKKIITITKENKDEVYRNIARSFHFAEFNALPEHIKDDYLEWNWKEFQKERRRIHMERELATKKDLYRLLQDQIEHFELVNKNWFIKAKFLSFRREKHFNPTNY